MQRKDKIKEAFQISPLFTTAIVLQGMKRNTSNKKNEIKDDDEETTKLKKTGLATISLQCKSQMNLKYDK